MIELASPWLLLATPVAAMPFILHLVRRRRPRDVGWGAMRFLAVVAAEQRRRLAMQERLLLTLRVIALLAAAIAASRPAWVERNATAPVLERAGRVACVLAIDNSAASGAGGGDDGVRALASAWLATLRDGDEVTVLPLSRLTEPVVDPLVDLAAARSLVEAVQPSAQAADHPALLLAALDRLQAHLNPHAEVVLVASGRAAGWHPRDRRWDELARRLAAPVHGSRERPHIVVLEAAAGTVADLAITAVEPLAVRVAPRARVPVRIAVAARGRSRAVTLRVALDGRTIDEQVLAPPVDGETEISLRLPPLDAGDHVVSATLIDAGDGFPASDTRSAGLVAEARLGILLAETRPGRGLDGSLGPLAAALDPDNGADPLTPFSPRRIAATQLLDGARAEELLAGTSAVVLGGVAALDAGALAAIERFVAAGGGLLVVPGDGIDPGHWSVAWFRGGDGVLPAPPGLIREHAMPLAAASAAGNAHALAQLFAEAGTAALGQLAITRSLELPLPGDGAPEDASAPLLLDDGTPLVIERRRGQGRSALLATALDGTWGDLPWRAAMVPLVRTLITDLAARPSPPHTLLPLQRPAFSPVEGARLIGPAGELPLEVGAWDGRRALRGPPLTMSGTYSLVSGDGTVLARRTVASELAAHDLAPTTATDAAAADVLGAWRAVDPAGATALVDGGQRHGASLWPWLLALTLAALLTEAWLCGRAARDETVP